MITVTWFLFVFTNNSLSFCLEVGPVLGCWGTAVTLEKFTKTTDNSIIIESGITSSFANSPMNNNNNNNKNNQDHQQIVTDRLLFNKLFSVEKLGIYHKRICNGFVKFFS